MQDPDRESPEVIPLSDDGAVGDDSSGADTDAEGTTPKARRDESDDALPQRRTDGRYSNLNEGVRPSMN